MAMDLERIEAKIDRAAAGAIAVSDTVNGIAFTNMSELLEFAKLLSLGGVAVRKHLRGNPGACLAITIQALEWRMSPIAVANKSYEVNDQLAYESQLIHAVIEARAPLKRRLDFEFSGEGDQRKCKVIGDLKGEPKPKEYESPAVSKINPKNSPLWKSDVDQQLSYYSARAWARRHCPDVLLGIYSKDEIEDSELIEGTATTIPSPQIGDRLRKGKPKSTEGFEPNKIEHQISEVVPTKETAREAVPVEAGGQSQPEPSQGEAVAKPAKAAKAPKEPKAEETSLERGLRILAHQFNPKDIADLQKTISDELTDGADVLRWNSACEARTGAIAA